MSKEVKNRRLKVGSRDVACRMTMGALVRYKRATGKDAATLTPDDLEGVMVLMYSCCISASHADGEGFTMSFEEFCDQLEPAAVNEFYAVIAPDTTGEQKKTSPQPKKS